MSCPVILALEELSVTLRLCSVTVAVFLTLQSADRRMMAGYVTYNRLPVR